MTFVRRPVRSTIAFALVAGVVLAGAACGIRGDRLRERGPDDVPFGLLRPDPTSTSTSAAVPAPEAVTVFLVRDDRLVAVVREMPRPVELADVVRAMTLGPNDIEAAGGLRSALGTAGVLRSVGVSGGIATVDLASAFRSLPPNDQILGLGQIVFTLTGRAGVGRVAFTLEGQPVDIPRGDGSLTGDSVSREDYPGLTPA